MIQRYGMDYSNEEVVEDSGGEFVRYGDYERLESENNELREAINQMRLGNER